MTTTIWDANEIRKAIAAAAGSATVTRLNRQTKTLVSVYKDSVHGWVSVCEDHQEFISHTSKRLASSWAAEPLTWCAGCQGYEEQ